MSKYVNNVRVDLITMHRGGGNNLYFNGSRNLHYPFDNKVY